MIVCTCVTSDGLGAATALLGKQFTEAVSAVRLLLAGSEFLAGQDLLTVSAHEAIAMEGYALVCYSALVDNLQGRIFTELFSQGIRSGQCFHIGEKLQSF